MCSLETLLALVHDLEKGRVHVPEQRQGLRCQDSRVGIGGARAHQSPAGNLQMQPDLLLIGFELTTTSPLLRYAVPTCSAPSVFLWASDTSVLLTAASGTCRQDEFPQSPTAGRRGGGRGVWGKTWGRGLPCILLMHALMHALSLCHCA